MTATQLLSDPNSPIHGFIAAWQRDGRAFLGFADWLEEQGLNGQARAWAWAALEQSEWDIEASGIRPDKFESSKKKGEFDRYHWHLGGGNYPSNLPKSFGRGASPYCSTFAAAIVWFLDRYAEVFGDSPVPLEEVAA